ncbi:isoflavone reductase family protein [Aspergillus coremiiformis]|uniref:Isoflavone reductase family protein n=1 Tax=Aspergillus coremiiformis TaxID=138285 RepID=A0A5N6ZBY5_9EURO|nr:isoflavone reductase family protein [Aspergillus coremiiformis]
MSSVKHVIIVGAGGHLGPHIVSAFDADPRFIVSILARESSRSNFPPQIPVHRVDDDYSEPALLDALNGQDVVVCTISAQGLAQQKAIIDAAVKAGVKHFVPSEFGPDSRNEQASAMIPFLCRAKVQIVEYLKSKEKEGLQWTAFVTGPFLDMAMTNFLGFNVARRQAAILSPGNDRWSATTRSTVGLAVKNAILAAEDQVANRYLFIDSLTVSQNEVLASLERTTGVKWETVYRDAEEEKRMAWDRFSKGNFSAIPTLMQYVTCVNGYGGNYMDYKQSANKLLSLPEESLDEVVQRIVYDEN